METRTAPVGLTIRPFDESDSDCEAAVGVWNANFTREPTTVDRLRYANRTRSEDYFHQRDMVELDGKVVAAAVYGEPEWCREPGAYEVRVLVLPEYQRRGIGTTLYDHILAQLSDRENRPQSLFAGALEDQPHSVKFLTDRGFEQKQRQQISRLDLDSFDGAPFAESRARFEGSGTTVKTFEDFEAEDPDAHRKMHEKYVELFRDVPIFVERLELTFDMFERELNSPGRLPNGILLAFDGDEIVGTTSLWKRLGEPGVLGTGLTAVARSHRRKGIATGLKLQAFEFAKAQGSRSIQTDNEENNPMYDLNVRLGFKPLPAWLIFVKGIQEAAGAVEPAKD